MKSFITVITITRNDLSGLIKTVESVEKCAAALVEPNSVEHLIIDGLSTDGTGVYLRNLKPPDSLIRKCVTEQDAGIYDAMNKGISSASGEYLIFLNSGDLFSKVVSIDDITSDLEMLAGAENFAGLAYSAIVKFNTKSIYLKSRIVAPGRLRLPTIHQSIVYKRAVIAVYPYDLSYSICGDFDNFCRIYRAGFRFTPIDRPLSIFVAGGTSSLRPLKLLSESIKIAGKYSDINLARIYMNSIRLIFSVIVFQLVFRINRILSR